MKCMASVIACHLLPERVVQWLDHLLRTHLVCCVVTGADPLVLADCRQFKRA